MRRRSYQLEGSSVPKYKYSFNDKTFDLSLSTSLDSKIGSYRAKPLPSPAVLEEKIKSSSNFTLDKLVTRSKIDAKISKTDRKEQKHDLKLPSLRKR